MGAATPKNVAAIERASMWHNLRYFLRLLNYDRKFLPDIATVSTFERIVTEKHKWVRSSTCDQAFDDAKKLLLSSKLLTHYDESLPLKTGHRCISIRVGAVISHVLPTGEEHAIAFTSRPLTKQKYSRIHKEALGIVCGVQKFHTIGRKFTLTTDHKPLANILEPKRGVSSAVVAVHLQRWAILLLAYSYEFRLLSSTK